MGTTTKMAIPYPEATGLVKDGWEDMKDIATQVDAKSGLVLINTTTFTSVASVALANNTFSSNYRNYLLKMYTKPATTDGNLFIKLRASGSDASGSDYFYGALGIGNNGTSYNFSAGSANTGIRINTMDVAVGNTYHVSRVDINLPFVASPTTFHFQSNGVEQTGAAFIYYAGGGNHNLEVSYDSVNIIASAGNITGFIECYGYNN